MESTIIFLESHNYAKHIVLLNFFDISPFQVFNHLIGIGFAPLLYQISHRYV